MCSSNRVRRADGIALVLVLLSVSLITLITVFFLSDVNRERRGIDQYSRTSESGTLADMAVNLVMGQISAATREGTAATPVSWACQPGMIRTYGTNGQLSRAYKLYSWDTLVEVGAGFDPNNATQLPASNWNTLTAQYTDLNAPVNGVYPIVDPSVANTGAAANMPQNGAVTWDFPSEFAIATDAAGYSAPTANKLPMPVKWLYVLQDGTWVAPTAGTGPTIARIAGATDANPVVGRIAFWTDDETSKVNVNTASEGTFWDTPKAGTQDELQFAANPPTGGEFQRIAGHPATTSLSAVFPEMRQGTFDRWVNVGAPGTANSFLGQLKSFYDLAPRIDYSLGGSRGGTYPVTSYTSIYAPKAADYPYTNPSTYAVTTDANRLYASADDLWFQPAGVNAGNARPANGAFGNYNLTAAQVARRRFLFTAYSRAPETTLFETPRVSLWPVTWPYANASYYIAANKVNGGGNTRSNSGVTTLNPNSDTLATLASKRGITPQELLLAFSSTLNFDPNSGKGQPYYFQRQNPDSPTWDYSSQHIARNLDVVGYLRREIGTAAPGMGGGLSLDAKWGGPTADWITLNCFDYSRSQINQFTYNPYPTAADATAGNWLLYSYTGVIDKNVITGGYSSSHFEPNAFTVTPLHVSLGAGGPYVTEGAYPTLKEVAVVFYATERNEPQLKPPPAFTPPYKYSDVVQPDNWDNLIRYDPANSANSNPQTTRMQAVMLFSFAQMNPGVSTPDGPAFAPNFWIKVTPVGGGSFTVNGSAINLPKPGGNAVQFNTLQPYSRTLPPTVAALFYNNGSGVAPKMFKNTNANDPAYWSLTSDLVAVNPAVANAFTFAGTKIRVDIYAPDPSGDLSIDPTQASGNLVSSQEIDFSKWNGSLPLPLAPRWNVRQAKLVADANGLAATGVFMPDPGTFSTTSPNWQAEIVPEVLQFSTMTSLSLDPRRLSTTVGVGTLQAGQNATQSNDPLVYAYKYTDAGGTQTLTNFATRVSALETKYSGTPLPVNNAEQNTSYTGGATATATTGSVYASAQAIAATQAYQLITPYDVAISMVSDPSAASAADPRLLGRGVYSTAGSTTFVPIKTAMASTTTPTPAMVVYPNLGTTGSPKNIERQTNRMQYHALGSPGGVPLVSGYRPESMFGAVGFAQRGSTTQSSNYPSTSVGPRNSTGLLLGRNQVDSELGVEAGVTNVLDPNADWTALPGNFMDGGYLARPDQAYAVLTPGSSNAGIQALSVPYFSDIGLVSNVSSAAAPAKFFAPNRQVPSPVILGTIPSSLTNGWQTLTFCPNPARTISGSSHPGPGTSNTPSAIGAPYTALPDHLLLDLFWMPVAEPYAISEQFSTAGKVNLNYAMMPFPYIQRKTALDAVLKSAWLTALPSNVASFPAYYKSYGLLYQTGRLDTTHTRFPVNVDATLKAFDYKFGKGDIFRSASQICDIFLYPNSPTAANTPQDGVTDSPGSSTGIVNWWKNKALTADNPREDPYSAIYSRVTTKSNTFTVHWKVQSLKKRTGSAADTWTEGQDAVLSEMRGSSLIERYIDPDTTSTPAANLPDYAADTTRSALPMSYFYKWRVASENYFRP